MYNLKAIKCFKKYKYKNIALNLDSASEYKNLVFLQLFQIADTKLQLKIKQANELFSPRNFNLSRVKESTTLLRFVILREPKWKHFSIDVRHHHSNIKGWTLKLPESNAEQFQ